ncbi:MAG: ribonuclease P protein component 1 [Candidatus Helarchaeota archaeon]
MTITPKTLLHHCLIGLAVKIVKSSNAHYSAMMGRVINETKNMLIIKTEKNEKRIPKQGSVFLFWLPDHRAVEVKGKLLIGRPEERIKKKISYKWLN